jgi:hypothetical protein
MPIPPSSNSKVTRSETEDKEETRKDRDGREEGLVEKDD